MRRYALFCCEDYYPGGGWNDFVDTFENIAVAKAKAKSANIPWGTWHIVDLHDGTVVARGRGERS